MDSAVSAASNRSNFTRVNPIRRKNPVLLSTRCLEPKKCEYLSQGFSGRKFDLREEMGECGVETIEGALGARRCDRPQGACGAKGPGIDARVEHRDLGTGRGDAIPMTAGDPFNEAVQSEPAEIIRHRARPVGERISTLELRDVIAEFPMPKACGCQREETQGVHERVDAAVTEAEPGCRVARACNVVVSTCT
jgi:hypothetical protein